MVEGKWIFEHDSNMPDDLKVRYAIRLMTSMTDIDPRRFSTLLLDEASIVREKHKID